MATENVWLKCVTENEIIFKCLCRRYAYGFTEQQTILSKKKKGEINDSLHLDYYSHSNYYLFFLFVMNEYEFLTKLLNKYSAKQIPSNVVFMLAVLSLSVVASLKWMPFFVLLQFYSSFPLILILLTLSDHFSYINIWDKWKRKHNGNWHFFNSTANANDFFSSKQQIKFPTHSVQPFFLREMKRF